MELDGVGGVNILVKADVHRSGGCKHMNKSSKAFLLMASAKASISHATPLRTRRRRRDLPKWPNERVTKL